MIVVAIVDPRRMRREEWTTSMSGGMRMRPLGPSRSRRPRPRPRRRRAGPTRGGGGVSCHQNDKL